ncbi:MAG TPA: transcriptional regulator, partial [Clostridia bacterium]|nr:transcriptional regulator [Clostridia bacterium]
MQNNSFVHSQARDDFNKARSKATISQLLNALTPDRQRLLSLEDVRNLLKPKSEVYKGMQTVPIEKIIGSEGRYKDFTSAFLPKRDFIRGRWESVDRAHLSDVILPAIKLYEIGGVYFVRDGNHRVSVARMQGVEAIDAEVIELDSEIEMQPGMTVHDLKNAVVEYEKQKVFSDTQLDSIIPPEEIVFSETGRYVEMLRHIQGHKYFLNQGRKTEIEFLQAAASWYNNLYKPIIRIIEQENIISRFPGRTMSDLYMWIIKHWDGLKNKYGNNFSLKMAALDYS